MAAYDSQRYKWTVIHSIKIFEENEVAFKKLLTWAKKTFKDKSYWRIITITDESVLPKAQLGTIDTTKFIRFKKKEDFILYKLTWK